MKQECDPFSKLFRGTKYRISDVVRVEVQALLFLSNYAAPTTLLNFPNNNYDNSKRGQITSK